MIEEYGSNRAVAYLQGATGVIKSWGNNGTFYYYQDKLGSTTHVANANGALLESFHYDLYGKPIETSAHGVVDLYAGERWIGVLGLYERRPKFISFELMSLIGSTDVASRTESRYHSNVSGCERIR